VVGGFVRHYRTRGVAWTVHRCILELKELWFDRKLGVDTWGAIPLRNLDITSEVRTHAVHYEPSPVPVIEEVFKALESLGIQFEQFVFVDLGCGKGRTLLRAAQLPFKQVVGVEVSSGLHQAALRNMARLRSTAKRMAPIECIREDAAMFKIPPCNTVLYMYHPFDKIVLNQVLDNLQSFLQATDASVYLVYVYPCLSEEIRSRGFLNRSLSWKMETMKSYAEGSTLDPPFEIWGSRVAGPYKAEA
jgi:SAM-dependent methyltransferase